MLKKAAKPHFSALRHPLPLKYPSLLWASPTKKIILFTTEKNVVRQSFFRFVKRTLFGVGEAHRGGGVLGEGEMLNKSKRNKFAV